MRNKGEGEVKNGRNEGGGSMRALVLWRTKALGASLPFPAAARPWSSAVESLSDAKKKKRNDIPVLGIDLPDVWDSDGSAPPAAPTQKAGNQLPSERNDYKQLAIRSLFLVYLLFGC